MSLVFDSAERAVVGLHHAPEFDRPREKLVRRVATRCGGVVLMAGGNGKRLAPLTHVRPKPLLKVGRRPILETIVMNFARQGFVRFWLSVNYLGDMIEQHFGDGARWSVDIEYLRESAPLGTAGALSLLAETPRLPIVVMNADVLTDIDFFAVLEAHRARGAAVTVCVRDQEVSVPYGVVEEQAGYLTAFREKPVQSFLINTGIYVIEPAALGAIPSGRTIDMPNVLETIRGVGGKVYVHKIDGYWCDIGQKHDLDRANAEFEEYFT